MLITDILSQANSRTLTCSVVAELFAGQAYTQTKEAMIGSGGNYAIPHAHMHVRDGFKIIPPPSTSDSARLSVINSVNYAAKKKLWEESDSHLFKNPTGVGTYADTPSMLLMDPKDVNLVLSPTGDPVELMLGLQGAQLVAAAAQEKPRVMIYQDGVSLAQTNAGADVGYVEGAAVVTPERPRMVRLVSNPGFEEHELRLEVYGKGAALFAFTFTTCVAK